MGKISPVSAKYIIHSTIQIDGVVDRPDVIGAVFGQTEGLLGADLELRELQRSGRIGRIEVDTEIRSGKTSGAITVPSSLDKAETAIIAAALEIIQRIGPCNAKLKVESIEDVRVSKRGYVIDRAKELLKTMVDTVMPDSGELAEEVSKAVRVMEVVEYGTDRLPAGPAIAESEEVIVVEGRADVLNLLKHGFKNVIGMNGTSVPPSISELSKKKVLTAFVDGDRGGDLILKELIDVAEIDYVTKAPDGKEVEELEKKEIHKALRARVVPEQLRLERAERIEKQDKNQADKAEREEFQQNSPASPTGPREEFKPREEFRQERYPNQFGQGQQPGQARRSQMMPNRRPMQREQRFEREQRFGREPRPEQHDLFSEKPKSAAADWAQSPQRLGGQSNPNREYTIGPRRSSDVGTEPKQQLSQNEKTVFREISGALIGTRGAYLFDEKLTVLGKVPLAELQSTLRSLNNVYAIVLDGTIDRDLVKAAEIANVKCVVAMDSKIRPDETRLAVATLSEL
ncbi:DNA primase [Candidatus Woesearchaeota archaeon]|nr:DNA primase [Candidatus Woesearchaeota archaeon]